MARVVIFGQGRGADTAFRYLTRDSPHEICAFAADAAYITNRTFHGLPVVEYETLMSTHPPDGYHMFVPLGFQRMNRLRAERYLDAKARGYRFISYVSSRVSSLEEPRIGENCFILDGQLLNLDVSIAGDVTVGDGCFLGVNASVSNGVRLGAHTFVGAQTIIDKDTPADSVYVSQPVQALPLKSEKFLAMLRLT